MRRSRTSGLPTHLEEHLRAYGKPRRHPMRDTQLEHIRELGCEIIDQIKPILDPVFALHPLVLTDIHIAGLRADARYAATDLDGTPFDWVAVADRLGDLWELRSDEWDGGRQPRKWQTRLDAKSRHLGGLADDYAKARAAHFKGDSELAIPLRCRHEKLHQIGVHLAKLLPISHPDLEIRLAEHLYLDGFRGEISAKNFLRDPYYAHFCQARYSDREDEWWQWDDFARVLRSIAIEEYDRGRRLRLPPEGWALADEIDEALRSQFAGPEEELGGVEPDCGTTVLGARNSPDHPSFELVLQGESIKGMADRLAGGWKVFDTEHKLLLRMWAKETERSQGELKLQLVTSGIIAAAEDCMELHHVKFGRDTREAAGEKIRPWEHFRDEPEKFSHWFKTYALKQAVEELQREGNARLTRKEKRLLEKEERKRLGKDGRRRSHDHDIDLGKRDQHDPSRGKHRKAVGGSAEMLSGGDEGLADASWMDDYEHDWDRSRRTYIEREDPFAVLMEEATFSEKEFFEQARALANELRREPTDDELAEMSGRNPEAIRQIKSRARTRHRDRLLESKFLQKDRRPMRDDLRNRDPNPLLTTTHTEPAPEPDCKTCKKVRKKNPSARILMCPDCGWTDPEAQAVIDRYTPDGGSGGGHPNAA
jgi:hypothetical protein